MDSLKILEVLAKLSQSAQNFLELGYGFFPFRYQYTGIPLDNFIALLT